LPGFLKLSASSYAAEEGLPLSDLLARAEESRMRGARWYHVLMAKGLGTMILM